MLKNQEKVDAFIDAQNLNLGVRSLGWKLDWRKSRLLRKFNHYVIRVDLLKGSLELKKTKISGRSKP